MPPQSTSASMQPPPAPEPTPGRKDVSLSSGSYTCTDEESEGAPKPQASQKKANVLPQGHHLRGQGQHRLRRHPQEDRSD